ncbi:MAG: hypothetical protein FD161_3159 [Limisphaerales bacterium]|nr:MAG: hypothetical protein FD161_3159 [Limisphaerales bacterium]TXT49145.1 MAG: hypothetical protein FD140_3254 [Limisphaerales bacterium]
METATLSANGRLVIPRRYRDALHLTTGDEVAIELTGGRLVVTRIVEKSARLVITKTGRKVLVGSAEAPVMSASKVNELLADFP